MTILIVWTRSPFLKGWIDLTKNPKKEGIEKLLKGRGILRRYGFCRKGGMLLFWVFFLAAVWENNYCTTFNDILVIVLFPLNVGVSPCFHCTVLVPGCRVYTACFYNKVVSSCYRLHTPCLHHAGVTSCFILNMWF